MKVISSVSLLFSLASSHSWLHCSDYDSTINGQDFVESSCNGYIRDWDIYGSPAFADDRGINYQPNGAWCSRTIGDPDDDYSSTYSSSSPMAQWTLGEEITLVWPAKNHANYDCFANIPDNSMQLYYNPTVNPDADPTFTSTPASNDWTLLIDWQENCTSGTDGCGFQNCPAYCDETDDAPCFQKYTVSSDDFSTTGYYTLMWFWEFNVGSYYTSCFEVYVDTNNTVNNTNTVTTDNGGDDDDNDNDSNSSTTNYYVTIPICYDSGNYDESTLFNGANNAFDSSVSVNFTTFGTVIYDEDGYDWQVRIATETDDAVTVNSVGYDYSSSDSALCDSIEDEFNDGGSCVICDPGTMTTYIFNTVADDDGDDDGDDDDDAGDDNDADDDDDDDVGTGDDDTNDNDADDDDDDDVGTGDDDTNDDDDDDNDDASDNDDDDDTEDDTSTSKVSIIFSMYLLSSLLLMSIIAMC